MALQWFDKWGLNSCLCQWALRAQFHSNCQEFHVNNAQKRSCSQIGALTHSIWAIALLSNAQKKHAMKHAKGSCSKEHQSVGEIGVSLDFTCIWKTCWCPWNGVFLFWGMSAAEFTNTLDSTGQDSKKWCQQRDVLCFVVETSRASHHISLLFAKRYLCVHE